MFTLFMRGRDAAAKAGDANLGPSIRWALTGLSLSMLLSSLGTSIANVSLPALAQAFNTSFQVVQWVVLDWRAIFLVNVPLGILTFLLAHRYLPVDRQGAKTGVGRFDHVGTVVLALTLAAYALAMTMGRGRLGQSTWLCSRRLSLASACLCSSSSKPRHRCSA